jgi:hypothetical protein
MANHTTEIFISDEKFYPRREIFIYDEKILTPREQSVAMEISDRCRRRLLETSNKKNTSVVTTNLLRSDLFVNTECAPYVNCSAQGRV